MWFTSLLREGKLTKLITDEYRELNSDLHSRNPLYGSKSYKQANNVVHSLGLKHGDTLLDYGCGKASLARELAKREIRVVSYDPAIQMYEKHPSEREGCPWKYLACMDVLEHIEPQCLREVLLDIKDCFTDKAYLLIATEPSKKSLKDGRNAHLIIQDRNWWLDRLEEAGFQIDALVDNRKGWMGVVCTNS